MTFLLVQIIDKPDTSGIGIGCSVNIRYVNCMLTLRSRQTSWVKKLVKAWKQMRGRRCFGKKNEETKLFGASVKVKKRCPCPQHEGIWGSRGTAPFILNLGTILGHRLISRTDRFNPGTYGIIGWLGPTVGLNVSSQDEFQYSVCIRNCIAI